MRLSTGVYEVVRDSVYNKVKKFIPGAVGDIQIGQA